MNEVDRVAAALCRTSPNHKMYHFPGDAPRKWRTPGGALWDTMVLTDRSADNLRIMADAAIAALKKPAE